jgi:hypothetical protein
LIGRASNASTRADGRSIENEAAERSSSSPPLHARAETKLGRRELVVSGPAD